MSADTVTAREEARLMDMFDLVNIAGRHMEIENPTSREKLLAFGRHLRLTEGSHVVDVGCGYGETLTLWAEAYGIVGIGIDQRELACERAAAKVARLGLGSRIQIVCANAAEYAFEPQGFDAAVCLGATFIWGGYRGTLRALSRAIRPGGRVGIGDEYWRTSHVPHDVAALEPNVRREIDLLRITREEGFDLEHAVRASHDDWDAYESARWHGLIHWLEENPEHPHRGQVVARLHGMQETYLRFGREHLGWAMYALAPRVGGRAANDVWLRRS